MCEVRHKCNEYTCVVRHKCNKYMCEVRHKCNKYMCAVRHKCNKYTCAVRYKAHTTLYVFVGSVTTCNSLTRIQLFVKLLSVMKHDQLSSSCEPILNFFSRGRRKGTFFNRNVISVGKLRSKHLSSLRAVNCNTNSKFTPECVVT